MPGVKCPHCGNGTAPAAEQTTGTVWIDDTQKRGAYLVQIESEYSEDGEMMQVNPGYRVVRCQACYRRFVVEKRDVETEEEYTYEAVWPFAGAIVDENVSPPVRIAVQDARRAHTAHAEIAALLAARTAIIRLQREQQVSSLKELCESGRITRTLYDQANEVRLWANAVGHEDIAGEGPDGESVEELLEYLDAVLDVLYVQPTRLRRLQERRPKGR